MDLGTRNVDISSFLSPVYEKIESGLTSWPDCKLLSQGHIQPRNKFASFSSSGSEPPAACKMCGVLISCFSFSTPYFSIPVFPTLLCLSPPLFLSLQGLQIKAVVSGRVVN